MDEDLAEQDATSLFEVFSQINSIIHVSYIIQNLFFYCLPLRRHTLGNVIFILDPRLTKSNADQTEQ